MTTAHASTPNSSTQASNPYTQTSHGSPGLAFALGFIPGLGAIYNGQYVKGFVHAGIVGLLISLISASGDNGPGTPFLALLLASFFGYMVFEAFHTAKKRRAGLPVDEFSSLIVPSRSFTRAPIGPIVLIGFGVLFLLDTLHILSFGEIARFWPVILIVVGAALLYHRVSGFHHAPRQIDAPSVESTREQ